MGLFSTTYNHHEVAPAYPQRVTVTENRAPTDESIKILRDIEERARGHVLQTFQVENHVVDGVVVVFQMSASDFQKKAYIRFRINGKDFSFAEVMPEGALALDRRQAIEMFFKAVREAIFKAILPPLAEEMQRSGM